MALTDYQFIVLHDIDSGLVTFGGGDWWTQVSGVSRRVSGQVRKLAALKLVELPLSPARGDRPLMLAAGLAALGRRSIYDVVERFNK